MLLLFQAGIVPTRETMSFLPEFAPTEQTGHILRCHEDAFGLGQRFCVEARDAQVVVTMYLRFKFEHDDWEVHHMHETFTPR